MEQVEEFRGALPLGTRVIYYPRAQVNAKPTDTSGPLMGLVHRGSDGQLDLVVFNYRGQPELKKAVFHVSHSNLYDAHGQISGAGYLVGCWDFLPDGASCGVDEKIESLSAAMSHTVDELVHKIDDMHNGLGGAVDAAVRRLKELEAQVAGLAKKAPKEDKPQK